MALFIGQSMLMPAEVAPFPPFFLAMPYPFCYDLSIITVFPKTDLSHFKNGVSFICSKRENRFLCFH
jgi:hypothetical protein